MSEIQPTIAELIAAIRRAQATGDWEAVTTIVKAWKDKPARATDSETASAVAEGRTLYADSVSEPVPETAAVIVAGQVVMPDSMLEALGLREGDEVVLSLEGDHLRVKQLSDFLKLDGVFEDDAAFDGAIAYLERAWANWGAPPSA